MISAARNRRGMDLQDTVVAAKAVYNSWFTPEFVLGNLHTFVGTANSRHGAFADSLSTGCRPKPKRSNRNLGMASDPCQDLLAVR